VLVGLVVAPTASFVIGVAVERSSGKGDHHEGLAAATVPAGETGESESSTSAAAGQTAEDCARESAPSSEQTGTGGEETGTGGEETGTGGKELAAAGVAAAMFGRARRPGVAAARPAGTMPADRPLHRVTARVGRLLAASGAVFIVGSLLWGVAFDGFRPDRADIRGARICLVGVVVIMYARRARTYDDGIVRVEVLYFDGCPNHEALLPHLRELLAEVDARVDIELVRIEDHEAAERERFLGSPTVRVDGQDVEPGADARSDFGLKCRLFPTPDGLRGTPADDWVLAALGHQAV